MKTDEQHLLPAHLAFYRRRLFWGVVFFIFFVPSTLLFTYALSNTGSSHQQTIYDIYSYLTISSGATLFRFISSNLLSELGEYIGSSIYFIMILSLGYKTFQKPKVLLRYPIILSILYVTGMIASVLLLGSFS